MSLDSIKENCELYFLIPTEACVNPKSFAKKFASVDCKIKAVVIALFASFLTLVIPLFVGITLGICKLLAGRVKQRETNISDLNADNIIKTAVKDRYAKVQ